MVQVKSGGNSSVSKWLIDQFTGGGECTTGPLSAHPLNSDMNGGNVNLQKLVTHQVPHKIDGLLIDANGFTQDFLDLVSNNSQVANQMVDFYVSADGLFPGGHGFKNVQSPKRQVVSMELAKALSFVFGTRGIIQKERMCLISSDEKHYIYQMDSRVLGDEFWNVQKTKSKLANVENLQGQLVGGSQFYRNMWISSDQSLTPIHYDNSENVFVQVLGKKHLIFWPPTEKDLLYLNGEDHPTSDRQTQIDLTMQPSEIKTNFPNFFSSHPVRITLNAGDIMFIPKGWPHMVLSEGNSISVNYWWVATTGNDNTMLDFDFDFGTGKKSSQRILYSTTPLGEIKSLDDLPDTLEMGAHFMFKDQNLCPIPVEYNKYYHRISGQTRDYYVINKCHICNSRYHRAENCSQEDEIYLKEPKARFSMVRPTNKPRNQKLVSNVTSKISTTIGDRIFASTCIWKNKIIVIGGPRAVPGQMILFIDIEDGNVSAPTLKNTEGKFVTETKWGHSSTCVGDKIYIFGGFDSQYQYNDLICYDISSSSLISVKTKGEAPSARAFHSATYVKNLNSLLIFGGQVCNGGPYQYFNDMYLLDLSSLSWKKVKSTDESEAPNPVSQHSAVLLQEKNSLLIIGGSDSTQSFPSVYSFDLKKLKWSRIYPGLNTPEGANFEAKNFRIHPTPQSAIELNDSTVAIIGLCDEGKGKVLLLDHNELSLRKANQSVDWVLGSFCSQPNTMHVLNSNQQLVTIKFDKIILNPQCPNSDPHNWNLLE